MSYRQLLFSLLSLLFSLLAVSAVAQSFASSQVTNDDLDDPTVVCFGPDQKLYILQQSGQIKVYTITRLGQNNYTISGIETINLVRNILNHNDDGTPHTAMLRREGTGMTVVGTPSAPVIYVTSSDWRVGGFQTPIPPNFDFNLDTNSGTISKLTKVNGVWTKVDLVRGLPRSEENHAINGIIYDPSANLLYVAQGGHTNKGSPSNFFAYLCEYALSAAILSIDLNVIDTLPVLIDTADGSNYIYDLPTVDDPTRSNANGINDPLAMGYNGVDLRDPFGGNDGLNQAKLVLGGPVQIYASGFRNSFDLVRTQAGNMYTWDNGANVPWGGYPANEGTGTATNNFVSGEPGSGTNHNIDGLHKIHQGYYGGHPCPIRCNPSGAGLYTYGTSGVFRTAYVPGNPSTSLPYDWPPVPVGLANPIEGNFLIPGTEDSSMFVFSSKSMNGLCEYTASNFGNLMKGDLLCTGLNDNTVYRVNLNSSGNLDSPDSVTVIGSQGTMIAPLDVWATGDGGPYPGTIWVVNISGDNLTVLEPADFSSCTGADNNLIDEDADGYTNADEIDNGSNPCNGADMPPDHDGTLIGGFKVSDLNDPDDDDDGINDTLDLYVWDPLNGAGTDLPIEYPLLTSDPGTGFYGLGFTGFMMNLSQDYLNLWKTEDNSSTEVIAGGAVGALTLVGVDQGDALNALNNQHNAFQFGFAIDSTDAPFVAEVFLQGPVFPDTIQNFQSVGMFLGTGDQDNYVKIVVNANSGNPGIAVVVENNGVSSSTQYSVAGVGSALVVRLALLVNPANGYVHPQYAIGNAPLSDLGDGFFIQGSFLTKLKGSDAIAAGVISTARGSSNVFEVTWGHISIRHEVETGGQWYTLNNGMSCQPIGSPGSCCQARHEAAYVQSGDKFYLLGGRENSSNINIYNPTSNKWTVGAAPDSLLHHFQAVDYYGLIIAAGAFRGTFPGEIPVGRMRVYNPITNTWYIGPSIPSGRRRGSAGAVVQNDTMYLIGGLTNGHIGGNVDWLDRYDMRSASWSTLPNAPNKRDHFHAVLDDHTLYAPAGRRTTLANLFTDTEPTVDRFNILTGTWDTIAAQIPTQRAGNTACIFDNELLVIGGERDPGYSNNQTEALNLDSLTWRTLDHLNAGRNGTQAIVNNGGIYVASGAAKRGGDSLIVSTEGFYLFGPTTPILTPTIASNLTATDKNFGGAQINVGSTADVYVYNTSGNQAILLSSLTMHDSTIFTLNSPMTFPRFLKPGDSLKITVKFSPELTLPYSDTMYLQHTGANAPVKKVVLTGTGLFNWLGTTRLYVDSSATGNGLGNSWTNAFTSMWQAMDIVMEYPQITEVWIARGTYLPINARSASFVIRDNLALYGGFSGTETMLSERDINANHVILSGDIGTPGDSTDNIYHVILRMGTSSTPIIDGVIIQDGVANGSSEFDKQGGGVLNLGKLEIRNTIIRYCSSVNQGSAIFNADESAHLTLKNMQFIQNSDPHLVNKLNAILIWDGNESVIQQE